MAVSRRLPEKAPLVLSITCNDVNLPLEMFLIANNGTIHTIGHDTDIIK